MLKNKITIAVLVLIPALMGWRKIYVEPTESFAEIRLINTIQRNLLAHFYAEADHCVGALDIGGVKKTSARVVRVALGVPATLSLQHFPRTNAKSCLRAFSFLPRAGHSYEATFGWDAAEKKCLLHLVDRDSSGALSETSSFVEREYKPPLFASRGFCAPLTTTEKAALAIPR